MTPRWILISYLVFGLVSLALGIMSLTDGDTVTGIFQLALGIAWLSLAIFKGIGATAPRERQSGE